MEERMENPQDNQSPAVRTQDTPAKPDAEYEWYRPAIPGASDVYDQLVRQLAWNKVAKETAAALEIGVFYLHVTQYCDLKCRHCGADAIPLPSWGVPDPDYILKWERVENIIALLDSGYDGELIVAGGGEPALELAKILEIARRTCCSSLVVVTNGTFGRSKAGARQCLSSFTEVAAGRKSAFPLRVKICISVDDFHQEQLPLAAIRNIIDARLELEAEKPGGIPVSLALRTLHGLDGPVEQLAKLCAARFEPPSPGRQEGELSIASTLVIPVQYARFMTKSARSKRVASEVPSDLTQRDLFPQREATPYLIGGRPGLLDLRIFEEGEVVAGREGHHNLILGHLGDQGLTIEWLKRIACADPIVWALREKGLEFVLGKAIATIPEIAQEVKDICTRGSSFMVERILHTLVKDDARRLRIAHVLAAEDRSPDGHAFAELILRAA